MMRVVVRCSRELRWSGATRDADDVADDDAGQAGHHRSRTAGLITAVANRAG